MLTNPALARDLTEPYGERWRYCERIATSFAESTVNTVVSKRFVKKQQMQWSKKGAHLLLQTRTKALDGTLREMFVRWYPAHGRKRCKCFPGCRRVNHPRILVLPYS